MLICSECLQSVVTLEAKVAQLEDAATVDNKAHDEALTAAQEELSTTKTRLAAATEAQGKATAELETLKAAAATVESERDVAQASVEELTAKLAKAQQQLDTQATDSGAASSKLKEQAEARLHVAEEAAASALAAAKEAASKRQDDLHKEIARLEREVGHCGLRRSCLCAACDNSCGGSIPPSSLALCLFSPFLLCFRALAGAPPV